MKTKWSARLLALFMCIILLTGTASAALGSRQFARGMMVSDKTSLVNGIWSATDEAGKACDVRENYFVYEQENAVLPIVAYGSTLYGRSTMAEIAKKVNARNKTIVAGINGSFFDLNTGLPYGLVITDGVLRISGTTAAVGFFENGKAIIGDPELKLTLKSGAGDWSLLYNCSLTQANGLILYSSDYDTRTKNNLDAYHVILKPLEDQAPQLRLNSALRMKVIGTLDDVKSCEIPEDGFVLCIARNTNYPGVLEALKGLEKEDGVTVEVSAKSEWTNVRYAVGGGDILLENGSPAAGFRLDSAKKSAARTAVGIQSGGAVVFYTVDGGNGSKGLTLPELAERMKEAGCVTALNLDGGGSTTAGVQYPGYTGNATVNKPEDGSLRACANYIFLVRDTVSTPGNASKLFVYPYDNQPVLPGAQLTLTTKAVDGNYVPTVFSTPLTYSAQGGTVSDKGVLTVDAARDAADPYVSVTASSGGLSATVRYPILDQISGLSVKREGVDGAFTKAILAGGSVTKLTASAVYHGVTVAAQDRSFTWACPEELGTIDAEGTFRAAETTSRITGNISVSYGNTKTEIAVTLAPADPFSDMKGHWAKDYVNELYFAGVLTGSAGKDGKQQYRPDDSMTRQEFLVALMRFLKVDVSQYASVQLPFEDSSKVASWALDAVKAAYSLKYLGGSSSGGKLYAKPASTISRQEAMAILSRTQSMDAPVDVSVLNRFSDAASVAGWARNSLASMVQMNIIGGSNGKLNPTGNVKRSEVAKMLYSLKLLKEKS